jgi:hypothetical protein
MVNLLALIGVHVFVICPVDVITEEYSFSHSCDQSGKCFFIENTSLTFLTRLLEDDIYLVPEIDGVRILSNEKHEFLQKVPSKLQLLY